MRLSYEFENSDHNFLYDSKIEKIVDTHKYMLRAAYGFACVAFKAVASFKLEFLEQKSNDRRIVFKTTYLNNEIFITLDDDLILIEIENSEASFAYDFVGENIELYLKNFCTNCVTYNIEQIYGRHDVEIIITIANRKVVFNIPLDVNKIIKNNIFVPILSSGNILDYKKFYMHYFYGLQSEYDKKMGTVISKYVDINGNYVLADQINIKNGFIDSYVLSSVVNNSIVRVLKNSDSSQTFEIESYDETVDVNKELKRLKKKGDTINLIV